MDQLLSVWTGLTFRRRVVVVAATLGMLASVLIIAKIASAPRLSLLYAGLDATTAGEVVEALEARGAVTEIRGNAIYVDAMQRDALRLSLAGEGLPRNGSQGYELLDTLSGFGTTAQMFDAAYWRAKEGELARTMMSNRMFSAARVHLSNPANDPFRQGQIEAASVTITMANGQLSGAQAMALRYLVASAVAGLQPDQVAVIDSAAGLVSTADDPAAKPSGLAEAKAEILRSSVMRLLEARVGRGNAIVEVSVEPVTEREEITERRIDPESRIAISSDSEETTNSAENAARGNVTVASELTDGDRDLSAQGSQSSESRTREIINYEVSETQRAILREPGAIRRLSVAVLVDGERGTAADGSETWQPRSENELADLRELVISAIGFDADRGDQITIRAMEFSPQPALPAPVTASFLDGRAFDMMSLAQLLVLGFVCLILGLFVVRPILLSRPNPGPAQLAPPGLHSGIDSFEAVTPTSGEILPATESFEPIGLLDLGGLATQDDPAERLRKLIEEKQDETIDVLNQWMNDPREVVQ